MVLLRPIREDNIQREVSTFTSSRLDKGARLVSQELQKIVTDEKLQLITYNHYYTNNIQKVRQDSLRESI
jgi:hypothetical protein